MQEQILGDFRIIKKVGQGSLGGVYLAEHRFMKKHYILKTLPKALSEDSAFVKRFEEQVANLAALSHPNLAKIHQVSQAQGVYFLVTDCIVDPVGEMSSLATSQERVAQQKVSSYLRQIASALDYLHGMSIAHGALKLSNILIGKADQVYLCDFGLASMITPAYLMNATYRAALDKLALGSGEYAHQSLDRETLSALGQAFAQNYTFLAPEQKRSSRVDVASDAYAFGVLSYHLLTGRFPEGRFELPSQLVGATKQWDLLVERCMHPEPQRRPVKLLVLLEEEKREGNPIEAVKARVVQATPAPKEQPAMASSVATRVVEKKDLRDATPAAITPPKDERYADVLKSMMNRDPVVTQYQPQPSETKNIEPLKAEMVVIQGGDYRRGSNEGNRDEMPAHKVILQNFAIDVHPVTNEQFVRFLEHMGGEKDENYNDLIRLKESRITRSAGKLSIESGYTKHPAVGVTWYGAAAYAKWIGKRLPTEAEWEVAARGGMEACLYPTGDTIERHQANFFSSDTTPVMSYAPNGYGLYDMVGNVYEWCHDWYDYNYFETSAQEPHNLQGPVQGVYRVLRGGCWKSLQEDMRTSHRHRNNPGTVNGTCGFRCASDVR